MKSDLTELQEIYNRATGVQNYGLVKTFCGRIHEEWNTLHIYSYIILIIKVLEYA